MPSEVSVVSGDQAIKVLRRELAEAREQQAATAEILKAISNSPSDPNRVFRDIAASATRLCDGHSAAIVRLASDQLVFLARFEPLAGRVQVWLPLPLTRGSLIARAVIDRQTIHIADLQAETENFPEGSEFARQLGHRTIVAVPLMRAGEAIGALVVRRTEVEPFTDRQIELLKIFADQAVIAIENARLFEAEQTRTRELTERTQELTETLEYQTATSDVLNVISRSPSNLQPVLDAIVKTAARLCQADFADFRLLRDGVYHLAATTADEGILSGRDPIVADRGSVTGRTVLEQRPVHVPDIQADPEHTYSPALKRSWRTALGVPLLRDGVAIGVIVLFKRLVKPFTQKQMALVSTFADQALIAIENTRLFEAEQASKRELRESLAYQTATSEVLSVISKSPNDLQPVLDAIVATAHRLCQAEYTLFSKREDDGLYHIKASLSADPGFVEWVRAHPIAAGEGSMVGLVAVGKETMHFPDCLAEPRFTDLQRQQQSKARTMLGVPLLRDSGVIGVIFLARTVVQPFTDRQIALVTTFADQAVIAIENARLFEAEQASTRELQEALKQQAGTADVLKVISRSAFDLQRVLDTLTEAAVHLCGADKGLIRRREGDHYTVASTYGLSDEFRQWGGATALAAGRGSIVGRVALGRKTVHIPDVFAEPDWERGDWQSLGDFRSMIGVPLLRDGDLLGILVLHRTQPAPFTEKQIELVETFADQAVIAIENARLFEAEQKQRRDLQEALEYQTVTSDVLNVISRSKFDLQPVLDTIAEGAARLCGGLMGGVFRYDGELMHLGAMTNFAVGGEQTWRAVYPRPASHDTATGRAILEKSVAIVADVETDARADWAREVARTGGYRSAIAVPMLREGLPIGTIMVARVDPGSFPEAHVELLKTFADQAVIAIENTRLFEEVQGRTRELTEALEHQTATAEILQVISNSPTDTQPVFDAIVRSGLKLFSDAAISIALPVGDEVRAVAVADLAPMRAHNWRSVFPFPLRREFMHSLCILDRAVVDIPDVRDAPSQLAVGRDNFLKSGFRAVTIMPLLRGDRAIGALSVVRVAPGPLSEKQRALLKTFADQAVIAIENTRLFEEVHARNRDLTALGEVGRAVSSTLDLKVVLKTIVDRAVALSGTDAGSIFHYHRDAGRFELGETSGLDQDVIASLRRLDIAAKDTGLGEAIATRQPLPLPDLTKRPSSQLRNAAIDAGLRASLIVPLLSPEGPLGTLVLQRRHPGDFPQAVISLMQAFADQSAIALENARLFNEIAQKSRELEIASQHKSQFVANMSHELRTPLAAILGYTELIQEGFYGPLPDKSMNALARIRSNGKHLLGLINTVLDIAKIESGQFNLNLGEYALENVVETARAATEALAESKKLELKTEVAKRLPIGIGDEQRLTQVLLNLVGNAIKFTDAGEVCITATASNGHFGLSVTDTGPGIPQEHQARIFEQFHQVDSSNTKAKGGTGLGLAIAKQIVEMHGGRIWVESTLGKGATFQMELPIHAENRKAMA